MPLVPAYFNDSGFQGVLDESVDHSRRMAPALNNGNLATIVPSYQLAPMVAVDSRPKKGQGLVIVPIGHRENILPVNPADFPHYDFSALERG